jgi:hypothetical protein
MPLSSDRLSEVFDGLNDIRTRLRTLYTVAAFHDPERALLFRRDVDSDFSEVEHSLGEDHPAGPRKPLSPSSSANTEASAGGRDNRSTRINDQILNFLADLKDRATADQILAHLEHVGLSEPRDSLITRISRLVQQDRLSRPVRGYYELSLNSALDSDER